MTEPTAQTEPLLNPVVLVIDEDRGCLADCVVPLIRQGMRC